MNTSRDPAGGEVHGDELVVLDGRALPAAAAYELLRAVYASTDAFVSSFGEAYPSLECFEELLAELARRPGSLFLVAQAGDEALGFLVVEPRPQRKLRHTSELHMGVRAEARGRGVGERLLAAARERLRRAGLIEIVYLMVRSDNAPARRLYERAGFTVLATLVNDTKIDGAYYDGVLMRLAVGEPEASPRNE
jgi:putative acetyltransferase